jgi:hypothetical protein
MTTRRSRPLVLAVAALAAGLGLGGCGGSEAKRVSPGAIKTLELPGAPADLLGLRLQREDVSATTQRVNLAFVDSVALYSLRNDKDLVQATLQVSHFAEGARTEEASFRSAVVNQIGSAAPREFRLGDRTVYLTTGTKQSIAVWFDGDHLFVLASRADYDTPRTLLRKALELKA